MAKQRLTYKKSGVDIGKANLFVNGIKGLMAGTRMSGVMETRVGFGSLFALDKNLVEPVLVSSTDGVGTKLLIAQLNDRHDTVGIDLVAMNVNDILCLGGRPLFFLDYIACGKVEPRILKAVVKGITDGCQQAGCSLIGGETAEMPGLYGPKEYDLAGFTVGVVEKANIIDGSAIKPGDHVIGLVSSGLHSNGYSLVRKVFSLKEQKARADELLTPTRIYVREVLAALRHFEIKGIAHVTGGAFVDKAVKILPPGKAFKIHSGSWPVPEIFEEIQERGRVARWEMFRTFNMGIGMILVVTAERAAEVKAFFVKEGLAAYDIGEVVSHASKRLFL